MRISKTISIGILVLLLVLVGIVYFKVKNFNPENGAGDFKKVKISANELTSTYSHPDLGFSFMYPSDYKVSSFDSEKGEAILIGDGNSSGIQILISDYGDEVDITEAMIKSDIPDLKMDQPQTVEIGLNRKGLAFKSDNPEFGSNSREVWFVYKGMLYQISTYAEMDDMLKKIFSTWQFK